MILQYLKIVIFISKSYRCTHKYVDSDWSKMGIFWYKGSSSNYQDFRRLSSF